MKDSISGGLLAFLISAPVVVICCGGKAVLIGASLFGMLGFLTGNEVLAGALVAMLGSIALLAVRSFSRARRPSRTTKEDDLGERQVS